MDPEKLVQQVVECVDESLKGNVVSRISTHFLKMCVARNPVYVLLVYIFLLQNVLNTLFYNFL